MQTPEVAGFQSAYGESRGSCSSYSVLTLSLLRLTAHAHTLPISRLTIQTGDHGELSTVYHLLQLTILINLNHLLEPLPATTDALQWTRWFPVRSGKSGELPRSSCTPSSTSVWTVSSTSDSAGTNLLTGTGAHVRHDSFCKHYSGANSY